MFVCNYAFLHGFPFHRECQEWLKHLVTNGKQV